jgi:LysR family hydrogen peroxide-inducible transcriptional activator
MLSHLKIRDLELVVALHEAGSVTQAAKRVGISEPAFCKRIQLVERQIKVRLFERGHDGTKATDPGLTFIARILESIHSFHRGVHEAQETKRGEHSKLCIGVSAFMPPELIQLLRSIELPLSDADEVEQRAFSAKVCEGLVQALVDAVCSPAIGVCLHRRPSLLMTGCG